MWNIGSICRGVGTETPWVAPEKVIWNKIAGSEEGQDLIPESQKSIYQSIHIPAIVGDIPPFDELICWGCFASNVATWPAAVFAPIVWAEDTICCPCIPDTDMVPFCCADDAAAATATCWELCLKSMAESFLLLTEWNIKRSKYFDINKITLFSTLRHQ